MKLLHHSQGYSQYTFIQKYRLSHISHSGLNRHWSIMWALTNQGNKWRSLPALTNSQSGSGGGLRKGECGTERNTGWFRGTQVAGSHSGMKVCPPEEKTQACSKQQPVFVRQQPAEVSRTLELCLLQHSQTIWTWKHQSDKLHLTTTALEGAPMLPAAAIKQEPFSVYHNRRQTPCSDHTVVGRRSNAAQWVQPGTARVYAHCLVTATLRLNSFPPSFKNWHTVRAGPSDFTLLHRCKRRQYSMFCWKCHDHIASISIYKGKL